MIERKMYAADRSETQPDKIRFAGMPTDGREQPKRHNEKGRLSGAAAIVRSSLRVSVVVDEKDGKRRVMPTRHCTPKAAAMGPNPLR
jgi:hypothetical protein